MPKYELLDYTIKKVAETGIKVAIHTHGPDGAPFPNIQKVVEMVKDPSLGVGCCMDLGHSVRMGEDIVKDIKKYKEWIYDIHIKDESEASKKGQTWEMGRGVMDFKPIVEALRKIKYTGKVSLEFEKNGKNPHPALPSRSDTCAAYATQRSRPCRQSLSYGGRTQGAAAAVLGYYRLHARNAIRTAPKNIVICRIFG